MSDLTSTEKRKLERLFGMGSGYVLNLSNRTVAEFVEEHTGRDIYDTRYDHGSGSKANRLRGFWTVESNHLVGKFVEALIDHGEAIDAFKSDASLPAACQPIVVWLALGNSVPELAALYATVNERDFIIVAKQVREAIEKNQPEAGLDRLHTFVIESARVVGERNGILVSRD